MILLEEIAQVLKYGGWSRINNFLAPNEASRASKQVRCSFRLAEIQYISILTSEKRLKPVATFARGSCKVGKSPGRAAFPLVSVFHSRTRKIEHPGIVIYLARARYRDRACRLFFRRRRQGMEKRWSPGQIHLSDCTLKASSVFINFSFRTPACFPYFSARFRRRSRTRGGVARSWKRLICFLAELSIVIQSEINDANTFCMPAKNCWNDRVFFTSARNVAISDIGALGSPSFIRKNRRNVNGDVAFNEWMK